MGRFELYAQYYDLLYRDKDYAAEAGYVHQLISQYPAKAKTLLNLGCGTGKHDYQLAKIGYQVTGVDLSADMVNQAVSNTPTDLQESVNFLEGDIRTVKLDKAFDIVTSLFHVMSYQTTNEDLLAAIDTAYDHLLPGGIFIFDCWYGPGVLTDPPVVRIKRLANNDITITRLAEPIVNSLNNTVDVNYTILINEPGTNEVTEIKESHRMRYLFKPEIELLITTKFELLATYDWLKFEEPQLNSWNAVFILQKLAK